MTHQSVTFWFDFANSIWPLQQCFSLILKQVWNIYIYNVQCKSYLLPAKVLYIVWVTETHATIAHEAHTHNQMHIYKTSHTSSAMWCMPYTVWMTKPHSWPGAHTRSRVDQLDGTNLTLSAKHVLHHPSPPVGWWCLYLVSCIMQMVKCTMYTLYHILHHSSPVGPRPSPQLPLYDTILYDIMYYNM